MYINTHFIKSSFWEPEALLRGEEKKNHSTGLFAYWLIPWIVIFSRLLNNNGNLQGGEDGTDGAEDEKLEEKKKELTFWQRLGKGVVAFLDLGLLKDPVYVNLMVGMSLAICAELNFSLLTPFILADRGFETDHIAVIMSVIAGLDIVFRFLAPFFSDYYKIQARDMYIIALFMLLFSRMCKWQFQAWNFYDLFALFRKKGLSVLRSPQILSETIQTISKLNINIMVKIFNKTPSIYNEWCNSPSCIYSSTRKLPTFFVYNRPFYRKRKIAILKTTIYVSLTTVYSRSKSVENILVSE